MRVVALTQKLDDSWYLCGVFEEKESQGSNSCPSHIIRRVGNGDMQQLPHGVVVGCAGVCQSEGVNTTISQNRILKTAKEGPF